MATTTRTFLSVTFGLLLSLGIWAERVGHEYQMRLSATGVTPYDSEIRKLMDLPLRSPPKKEEIQTLVAQGFPKSIDDAPRAAKSHEVLNGWGHDVLIKAFRAAIESNPERRRYLAQGVRHAMMIWCDYGTYFGDFNQNPYDYGNVNLELVWFLGNLVRAARIIAEMSDKPNSGIYGLLSHKDKNRFLAWLRVMEAKYTSPWIFPSGKSNRKASQLELQLRSAALRKDYKEIRLLVTQTIPRFINMSIDDRGIIFEDTPRDKYHPQFFLASTLQSLEIGKKYGIYLDGKNPEQRLAIQRLGSALSYAAFTNMDSLPPKGFEGMKDSRPNYQIPFWFLAPRFYKDYGLPVPAHVLKMVGYNYVDPSHFDFTLMWGFNAVATARGL